MFEGKRRKGTLLALFGFALMQAACGVGTLALVAVGERDVGIALTVAVAVMTAMALGLVAVGAALYALAAREETKWTN